jgi:hypothetical protein
LNFSNYFEKGKMRVQGTRKRESDGENNSDKDPSEGGNKESQEVLIC